jgi:hypothetical protein
MGANARRAIMTRIFTALAIAVGVIIIGGAESSAAPAPDGVAPPVTIGAHPCKPDFDKFCAGKVVCGKGACHACLNAHMADLGKECAALMSKWDEKEEDKLSKEVLNSK